MIRQDRSGDVLTLTLDRSDKANSLTAEMLADIAEAVEGTDAGFLILTGAGEKVFSAGMDLEEAKTGLATSPVWERASGAIAAFPGLSIAALNGTLAGGAFGMALACDLRLAAPKASFFYPVAKLGFLPQPSDPARLAALIGPARAKMILCAGARLEAEEALAMGLVDRLVPDVSAAASEMVVGQPDHVAAIKAMVPARSV
ncbi:MAG: enoyl-CoA hydratase/isomerase family protein [Pseudomonadota bacterium]